MNPILTLVSIEEIPVLQRNMVTKFTNSFNKKYIKGEVRPVSTRVWEQGKNNAFFASFLQQNLAKTHKKNVEKGDFEYCSECVAPKGWSKYTIGMVKL